jgi:hypothetical protein
MAQRQLKPEQVDIPFDQSQADVSRRDITKDMPPSVKQVTLGLWFAKYKNSTIPEKSQTSNRHWWKWINTTLTKVDIEDAYAASIDFRHLIPRSADHDPSRRFPASFG